jgi:aryl-alcohol dehydrogenase-like predicted oxidoreductase
MNAPFVGRTGLRISPLVMGTMSFGGDADEAMSKALFHRAMDAGIHTFDCADVYAGGRSEELLGRFAKPHREQLVLTTKAYFPTSDGPNARGGSRYHLVQAVEASLRRLQTDRIDIFFLHRHDEATDLEESLRGLEQLIRQGKILYPAVSNFSAWQTMKALGCARSLGLNPIVATQPMYNLVKRQAEVEILPMAASEGIAVLPYSPLGGGLLTGKYSSDRQPEAGRLVTNTMYTTRYGSQANYDIAERFTALAQDVGIHPVTLAIAWVASHPAVTAPLIGARHLEQLEPALAALDVPMTSELRARISALSPTPPPATDRNEESSAHNYGSR